MYSRYNTPEAVHIAWHSACLYACLTDQFYAQYTVFYLTLSTALCFFGRMAGDQLSQSWYLIHF